MKNKNMTILLISILLWFSCEKMDTTDNYNQVKMESEIKEKPKRLKYLALGDSYTIGESVAEEMRFPVQLVKKLNDNNFHTDSAIIVARTGWTTDELSFGIKQANISGTYDLVTLLIGVNNQYRGRDTLEYRKQFRELLQTAIQFAGNNEQRVIVISIPDYGVTPFGKTNEEKIAKEIDIFNRINREETEIRKANYVNITGISRTAKFESSLIASDGLHPSGAMYTLWVESIFPVVKIILNN